MYCEIGKGIPRFCIATPPPPSRATKFRPGPGLRYAFSIFTPISSYRIECRGYEAATLLRIADCCEAVAIVCREVNAVSYWLELFAVIFQLRPPVFFFLMRDALVRLPHIKIHRPAPITRGCPQPPQCNNSKCFHL